MFDKTKEELIDELNHIACCYTPGGFAYLNETRSYLELNNRLHEIVVEVGRLGFCVRHKSMIDMTLDEVRNNCCYLVEVPGLANEVNLRIGNRTELTDRECGEIILFIDEFSSMIPC